jgi:hypothetical protein
MLAQRGLSKPLLRMRDPANTQIGIVPNKNLQAPTRRNRPDLDAAILRSLIAGR